MINRKQFVNELMLRTYIRKAIDTVKEQRNVKEQEHLQEEKQLRSIIRHIISESDPAVSNDAVHRNTGINALEDLFKNSNLLTVLRQGYKSLTSKEEQRESYKNHILAAALSSLETESARHVGAEGKLAAAPLKEIIDIAVGEKPEDNPAFIDVEEKGPTEEEEVEEFSISGQDRTGRNRAYTDYKNVEKNIITAFDNLDDPNDRDMFRDYLLTNLKLYFDRFEEELATDLPAPDIGMPPEAVPVPAGGMPLEEVLIDTEEIVEWLSYEDTKN
jgi:hypothetical protein